MSKLATTASCNTCSEKNPTQVCPLKQPAGYSFTDYRPRCAVNAELVGLLSQQNVINSSYEARMFLQQNAEKYMDMERSRTLDRMMPCAPCKRPFTDDGTMAPERYVVRCTPVSCERTEVNPSGIGDGRKYA